MITELTYKNWEKLLKNYKLKEETLDEINKKYEELKSFAIWMSGCGYDFAQHEYFIQNRHLLEGLGGQDDK